MHVYTYMELYNMYSIFVENLSSQIYQQDETCDPEIIILK